MQDRDGTLAGDGLAARVRALGRADLVVGVTSFDHERSVGQVIRAVETGLARHFPSLRSVVISVDGGSADGSVEAALAATSNPDAFVSLSLSLPPLQRLTGPGAGFPGRPAAFRRVFEATELLGAQGCVVVDAGATGVSPDWLQLLALPLVEHGFDFIAPYYLRHKYDGTIANAFAYPVTRALYGYRVPQPLGTDVGVSARFVRHCLDHAFPRGSHEIAAEGLGLWLTTTALCGGFRLCQAFLGSRQETADLAAGGPDPAQVWEQVSGTLFDLMARYEDVWAPQAVSHEVPTVGFRFGVNLEPVTVDVDRLLNRFRTAVPSLKSVWSGFFNEADLLAVEQLSGKPTEDWRFDDDLWARLVYDVAVAHRRHVIDRRHLLRSCLPLLAGWAAGFVAEMRDADAVTVNERIERLCRAFEHEKSYLLARWRSRD